MKRLALIAVLILLGVGVRAQFDWSDQPFLGGTSLVSTQAYATNLAHRWVSADLTNDIRMSNWFDRITGTHFLGSYKNHNISNTASGLRMTSAGSALTNKNGLSQGIFQVGPNATTTNWAFGMIFKLEAPTSDLRSLLAWALNSFFIQYQFTSGNNGPWTLSGNGGELRQKKDPYAFIPGTNWVDMVVANTNGHGGITDNHGQVFIDGVLSTNYTASNGGISLTPSEIGLYDYGVGGDTTDLFGMRGYLVEVWVRTNGLFNATGAVSVAGMAADMHYVRTNVYGLSSVSLFTGLIDDMESYTAGNNLNGLNGGAGWNGAYVVKTY